MAAATAAQTTFVTVEKHWPALKRTLQERFKDLPAFQTPSMAALDLVVAVIALDLQALPNVFPKDQANRLRRYVLSFLEIHEEYGTYVREEIALYEEAFRKHLSDGHVTGDPISAIPVRLLNRWFGGGEGLQSGGVRIVDPLLLATVTEWLFRLTGTWKEIQRDYRIVAS